MTGKAKITRPEAMEARPVVGSIIRRETLKDGGERVTISYKARRWQRLVLRAAETGTRQFDLDRFGVEILNLCDGHNRVSGIIEAFAAKHRVDQHEAQKAVIVFLRMLIAKGVISMVVPKADTPADESPR